MPRGSRPGERRGGREKGTPNKRTAELKAAMEKAAQGLASELGERCFAGDAHELLQAVYKDLDQPIALRVDAAKVAIAFEKPRLAATELSGTLGMTHEERLAFLNQDSNASHTPSAADAEKPENGKSH